MPFNTFWYVFEIIAKFPKIIFRKNPMNTQLFNAMLMTDKGFIIEDVEVQKVEKVIPYLQTKHDLRDISHFVISLGEKMEMN